MKRDSRNFTHVYVAKCGRFAKIGGTVDVRSRVPALRATKGTGSRLIKAWAHARAYDVEGTAIWLMIKEHEREGREWFLAPIAAAVAAVEKAIEMVDAGNVAPFTKNREKIQRFMTDHETYAARCKAAMDEMNAWAEANPEAFARECERARQLYEFTMAKLRGELGEECEFVYDENVEQLYEQ
jgi:hypothetical protein